MPEPDPTTQRPLRLHAEDTPGTTLLSVLRGTTLVVGIIIFVAWYMDHSQGMTTPWESRAAVVMGMTYLMTSLLLWLRPAWIDRVLIICLCVTSVYFLGSVHAAAVDRSGVGLYSLSSNAQFMPLLYVAAFIALKRGGALLSWLHYLGVLLLYIAHKGWPHWHGLLPTAGDELGHIWLVLLMTHPCYIVALQYITLLKSHLLRSQQLAHQDKQHFLAMLSHEIRSPLQAMLGSIDLLALKVQQPPERRAVDRLRHAASQLEAHLRDVTEFTRLEDPAWQLHTEPVDLQGLIRDTIDTWMPHARAKAIALRCEIAASDEDALAHGRTDPQRVRQILGNLLSNAIKYTPSGHITVHASVLPGGARWRLEVSDTGIGMPQEQLARIFDPYVRLEDPRAGSIEGSGLGLAVVQRLVDRLQGQLRVESVPERGSAFIVTLPLLA